MTANDTALAGLAVTRAARGRDAAVIERSLREPEAFAELFDRHADAIHRYVARRLGREVAEDLLAETFAVAFARRRRYDLVRPDALPWLYGIATNLVNGHRRDEARRFQALARTPPPDALEPMADVVTSQVTAAGARAALHAALARLPPRQRDVVLLSAWADLDYQQISEALGVPVGTVRSRLHRARSRLRIAIGADHVDGREEPWTR
jgi:RNA polymerase sigma-70 factor (ECF subfamily)